MGLHCFPGWPHIHDPPESAYKIPEIMGACNHLYKMKNFSITLVVHTCNSSAPEPKARRLPEALGPPNLHYKF